MTADYNDVIDNLDYINDLVECEGYPDICLKLSTKGAKKKILVIYKGKPVKPEVSNTSDFTEYCQGRHDTLRNILMTKCGLTKDIAKDFLDNLETNIQNFFDQQIAKFEEQEQEEAEKNRIAVEKHRKQEEEAQKAWKEAQKITVTQDTVIGKLSLQITFEQESTGNYWKNELFLNGELTNAHCDTKLDLLRDEKGINYLKFYVSDILCLNKKEAIEAVNGFMSQLKPKAEKIACLNPAYADEKARLAEELHKRENNRARDIEAKKRDKYAGVSIEGKDLYFDCVVPYGYRFSYTGIEIYRGEKKVQDPLTGKVTTEPIWKEISSIRIMITGRFTSDEGVEYVQLKYIDNAEVVTIHTTLASIIGVGEFRKQLHLNTTVRITDNDLKEMLTFFNKVINANRDEKYTGFIEGSCYTITGFKDDAFTIYVSGERLFTIKDKIVLEDKCIFTDVENLDLGRKNETKGDYNEWKSVAEQLVKYTRVLFASYVRMSSVIARFLGVDNCTIGYQKRSGTGKTITLMFCASFSGNPSKQDGLLISGNISETAIQAALRANRDDTVFVDDTYQMAEKLKRDLAYFAANGQEKARGTGEGKFRTQKLIASNLMINTEDLVISEKSMDGAGNRCIIEEDAPLPVLEQKIIRKIKRIMLKNYGHVLRYYLEKFALHKDELQAWFESAVERIQATTDSIDQKRQAEYYALAEVSGKLLKEVFDDLGIETANPTDTVNQAWDRCVIKRNSQPLAVRALNALYNYFTSHPESFVKGLDSHPPKGMKDLAGWYDDDYIELQQATFYKILKDNEFDKVQNIKDGLKDFDIVDCNSDGFVKSVFRYLTPDNLKPSSLAVVKIKER